MDDERDGTVTATASGTFERADVRWYAASQAKDWLILFVIGVIHFAWMLVVFLLEPGIR